MHRNGVQACVVPLSAAAVQVVSCCTKTAGLGRQQQNVSVSAAHPSLAPPWAQGVHVAPLRTRLPQIGCSLFDSVQQQDGARLRLPAACLTPSNSRMELDYACLLG